MISQDQALRNVRRTLWDVAQCVSREPRRKHIDTYYCLHGIVFALEDLGYGKTDEMTTAASFRSAMCAKLIGGANES